MKALRISLAISVAFVAFSCAKEIGFDQNEAQSVLSVTELKAGFSDTMQKTVVGSDGQTVLWSPAEEINVFLGARASGKFVSTNTVPVSVATFTGALSPTGNPALPADKYLAAYPYNAANVTDGTSITLTIPSSQVSPAGSFDPKAFGAVACSDSLSLSFKNVCGGIVFKVTREGIDTVTVAGNAGEVLAGKVKLKFDASGVPFVDEVLEPVPSVSVTCATGSFVPGESYFVALLPAVLESGVSLKYSNSLEKAVCTGSSRLTVKRSVFGVVDGYDKDLVWTPQDNIRDLSLDGTANCYIVSEAGAYCFNAGVKGNSSESVGNPVSADVLWESFGTASAPTVGQVIDNALYQNGRVFFNTPKTLSDGNAVVAVRDAGGAVLWSWHIWVCGGFSAELASQSYANNAGIMMDRNLGATSSTPGAIGAAGVLYQWGRKDPFPGPASLSGNTVAATSAEWPDPVSAGSGGTVAYAVANPMTFICGNNWLSSPDRTLWGVRKSIYDPCPAGWKVPETSVWTDALKGPVYFEDGPYVSSSYGFNFNESASYSMGAYPNIWYPLSGVKGGADGIFRSAGSEMGQWSCSASGSMSEDAFFYSDGLCVFGDSRGRSDGLSVRCQVEPVIAPADCKNLSSLGTSNCYLVSKSGNYSFNATVKGKSDELVGIPYSAQVLWESFGTDKAPKVGDLVRNVSIVNGYVKFSTPDPLVDGNAVIAVKDRKGEILWSWHIWICGGYDYNKSLQVYNNGAGKMMDRNLGATSCVPGSVGSFGLLYQWGRKDPFLGSDGVSGAGAAGGKRCASTVVWPESVAASSLSDNIRYSVRHPLVFIGGESGWTQEEGSLALWGKQKTAYDPCPAGWKVPEGGSKGLWAKAFGSSAEVEDGPWDAVNKGFDFGSGNGKSAAMQLGAAAVIWYPAPGLLWYDDGLPRSVKEKGQYWSATIGDAGKAFSLAADSLASFSVTAQHSRSGGLSVRCQKYTNIYDFSGGTEITK